MVSTVKLCVITRNLVLTSNSERIFLSFSCSPIVPSIGALILLLILRLEGPHGERIRTAKERVNLWEEVESLVLFAEKVRIQERGRAEVS